VRTQGFAYPLFAILVFLLAADSRRSSRRVYWSLPLLVLWSNLHGSATLAAGLVTLRALSILWDRRHRLHAFQAWIRPVILGLGAPLCLFVTPYGGSMAAYYRETLLNPALRHFSAEWQPLTAAQPLVLAAFFVLVGVALWSFRRFRHQTTVWERAAFICLAGAALATMRNVEWFGITALTLVPVSIDPGVRNRGRSARPHPQLNFLLAGVAAATLVAALLATVGKPSSSFERPYSNGAIAAVESAVARDPGLRVFADEAYADWLLWRIPGLRGRVAYDARFELVSSRQLTSIANFKLQRGRTWKRAAQGYGLLVLPTGDRGPAAAFERETGRRILYAQDGMIVILRAKASASA
jgi:hypothetical protein